MAKPWADFIRVTVRNSTRAYAGWRSSVRQLAATIPHSSPRAQQARQSNVDINGDITSFACRNTLCACIRAASSREALELLESIRGKGLLLRLTAFNAAISACIKVAHWQSALVILNSLGDWQLQADVISYSAAIGACSKVREWLQAVELLDLLPVSTIQSDLRVFGSLLGSFATGGHWLQALPSGLMPDTMAHNAGLTSCQRQGRWDAALPLVQNLRVRHLRSDLVTRTAFLSALNRGRCWQLGVTFWGKAPDCDEALRIATLTGAGAGGWDRALVLLRNDDGHKGFGVGIKACGDSAAWRAGLGLLQSFEEKGQQWKVAIQLLSGFEDRSWNTDVITHSAAITACAVVVEWPCSLHLFHQLHAADTIALNAAVAACEQGGEWQAALHLLWAASQMGPELDLLSFNSALSACAVCTAWLHALKLFEVVRAANLQADAITYSAALTAHAATSSWCEALALLCGVAAAAMAACGAASEWAAALRMLEAEEAVSEVVDQSVMRVACAACCQGHQWQRACLLALTLAVAAPIVIVVFFNHSRKVSCAWI
ncbi:Pentatricopeptide repeat-containing protein, chloroplastic [Symbiodinium microadriaticum]|uniref:Pentatricopeptide repeat-containing protein, chloroplastic n=1 Tax=Symbiodinium microadriaticum TaxID=2951 RepID=A0A1Q9F326_SYMMI|nr:Pentatricopeptide repeat-containing protein, chloroplastic [Symbiodinium microadriaticum]